MSLRDFVLLVAGGCLIAVAGAIAACLFELAHPFGIGRATRRGLWTIVLMGTPTGLMLGWLTWLFLTVCP